MSHTGFLWDSIVEEIKRQHCEVDIEIFGRQLEDCERTNVEKVIDLYSELKAPNEAISDENLLLGQTKCRMLWAGQRAP